MSDGKQSARQSNQLLEGCMMRAMQLTATLLSFLFLFGCGGGGSSSKSASGSLQLNESFYEVSEAANEVTVVVNRINGVSGEVTVDYATSDGTSNQGVDYAATSGTMIFGDGVASQSFVVGVIDDAVFEDRETFTIALADPSEGAALVDPTSAIVTILDDDAPPQGTLQFSADSYEIAEDAGELTLTVNREDGSLGQVSVDYATGDGTATNGADYLRSAGTLIFGDGVLTQSFSINIINSQVAEEEESFFVSLSNATGGAVVTSPANAVVTIRDSDAVPVEGTLRFSASAYRVSELDSGLEVIVERIGGSVGEVTVGYATNNGTAIAGQDYFMTSGQLIFGEEVLSQVFTVNIIDDVDAEPPETFSVALSSPSGGATLASPATSVVTISDDDSAVAPVYDLEYLNAFQSISGKDNWVVSRGDAVVVNDATSVNGTQVLRPASLVIYNTEARVSRVNDTSYSFTPIDGDEVEVQFETTGEAVSLFALGQDLDADGALSETDGEIGPAFGIFDRKFAIKEANLGALTSVELGSGNSGDDWYKLRLRIDILANDGEGAGNLSYMNLSDGDTDFVDVVGLQNINLKLERMDANAGPATWNTMFLQLITDGGSVPSVDNLEPNTSAQDPN